MHTLSVIQATVFYALIELAKSVQGSQYLHARHGIQHVRIVPRSSAEATVLVQARKDKVEQLSTWQSVRTAEQMQCSQSPIQAVETQVLGEPVLELVFALKRVSAGSSSSWCLRGYGHAQSRGFGCSGRACR